MAFLGAFEVFQEICLPVFKHFSLVIFLIGNMVPRAFLLRNQDFHMIGVGESLRRRQYRSCPERSEGTRKGMLMLARVARQGQPLGRRGKGQRVTIAGEEAL